jgi:hypothetical protein
LKTVSKISLSSYSSAPDGWPLNCTTTLREFRRKLDQIYYVIRFIFENFLDFQILLVQRCIICCKSHKPISKLSDSSTAVCTDVSQGFICAGVFYYFYSILSQIWYLPACTALKILTPPLAHPVGLQFYYTISMNSFHPF